MSNTINIEIPRKFKYQDLIDGVLAEGVELPALMPIAEEMAYRFISTTNPDQNHLPAYVRKPQRLIQDREKERLATTNFALSCFPSEESATAFYSFLKKGMKHISQNIGDALSEGLLVSNDGLKTEEDEHRHYDLYEFEGCNLNTKFNFKKMLL